MHLPGSGDQRSKNHRCGSRIVERRMRRRNVEAKLRHQPGQTRRLAFRKVEHEPCQRGRVDDRMLQWTFEPPAYEPRVESVVAVLHENSTLGEAKERSARVAKLRSANQHRSIDVMALLRIRVDWRAAVDERVKE
jgi:alkylhydroperoxidase family enzyme